MVRRATGPLGVIDHVNEPRWRKRGIKSDINVTPLVDVMLVLLIIMMIVAPLLQQGVDVQAAVATNSTEKPERRTRRSSPSRPTGAFWLNAVQVPDGRPAPNRVEDIFESKTERIVIIKADEDVDTATSWTRWTSCAAAASRTWA